MTKQDLKNGDVVETRQGKRYIVIDDTLVGLDMDGSYMSKIYIRDDLTAISDFREFDIAKVMKCQGDSFHKSFALIHLKDNLPWTWTSQDVA